MGKSKRKTAKKGPKAKKSAKSKREPGPIEKILGELHEAASKGALQAVGIVYLETGSTQPRTHVLCGMDNAHAIVGGAVDLEDLVIRRVRQIKIQQESGEPSA